MREIEAVYRVTTYTKRGDEPSEQISEVYYDDLDTALAQYNLATSADSTFWCVNLMVYILDEYATPSQLLNRLGIRDQALLKEWYSDGRHEAGFQFRAGMPEEEK